MQALHHAASYSIYTQSHCYNSNYITALFCILNHEFNLINPS